jgi:hypothetical protein
MGRGWNSWHPPTKRDWRFLWLAVVLTVVVTAVGLWLIYQFAPHKHI